MQTAILSRAHGYGSRAQAPDWCLGVWITRDHKVPKLGVPWVWVKALGGLPTPAVFNLSGASESPGTHSGLQIKVTTPEWESWKLSLQNRASRTRDQKWTSRKPGPLSNEAPELAQDKVSLQMKGIYGEDSRREMKCHQERGSTDSESLAPLTPLSA